MHVLTLQTESEGIFLGLLLRESNWKTIMASSSSLEDITGDGGIVVVGGGNMTGLEDNYDEGVNATLGNGGGGGGASETGERDPRAVRIV